MKSITIIGSGNVANSIGAALFNKGYRIDCVFSRDIRHAGILATTLHAKAVDSLDQAPMDSDLYIIAVSDSAIGEVSDKLPGVKGLVAHTSGTMSIGLLGKHRRRGVFYPLQSMMKTNDLQFSEAPFLLEAMEGEDLDLLKRLAAALGSPAYEVNSDQRPYIHLAAVFANNFTNHLFQIAYRILADRGLSFEMLKPLIRRTVANVQMNIPGDVQTGPAKRGDMKTMENHLELLIKFPAWHQLYDLLSRSIMEAESERKKA